MIIREIFERQQCRSHGPFSLSLLAPRCPSPHACIVRHDMNREDRDQASTKAKITSQPKSLTIECLLEVDL